MKNLKNKMKSMNGITLIALVITIVILIILAGVAINTLVNNGIIDKAKTATQEYKNAQDYEETQIAKYTNEINGYVDGTRGTVTLTEEEYALFKSQFSKSGNVSISKPNTWTVGTEYDFGDGVYGQRFTGTISASANEEKDTALDPIVNLKSIIYSGGSWIRDNNGSISPAVQYDGSNVSAILHVSNTDLRFRTRAVAERTNAPYDVWMLYTK